MNCNQCGTQLKLSDAKCPSCGTTVPMGRLTGILGIVCRNCDAYNEPGTVVCVSCGQSLGGAKDPAPAPKPAIPPKAGPSTVVVEDPILLSAKVPSPSAMPTPIPLSQPPDDFGAGQNPMAA